MGTSLLGLVEAQRLLMLKGMLMKSIGGDDSIKESMTDEAIKGMVNSMLGE